MARGWILAVGIAAAWSAGCVRHRRAEAVCPVFDRSDGHLPELRAQRVAPGAIRIDGRLDEHAWRAAECSGGFVNPGSGAPEPESRVNASAWLAWDDANLYVAVRVDDGDPAAPFPADAVDPHVWERSSGVELMLQPGDPGDNREYYEVQVDTGGAKWSTAFDDYNDPITDGPGGRRFGHQEWEPAIVSAATVETGRYTIEFALPWAAVHSTRTAVPPRSGDVWRINLYSFRDGQADALAWSPILGQGNFHRASRFGRLDFVGR